jgi:ATP synthase F subunit
MLVGPSPVSLACSLDGPLMMTTTSQIADRIRHRIDTYTQAFPTVLEIPSKDHPYDPEKDSVLRRVRRLFGE